MNFLEYASRPDSLQQWEKVHQQTTGDSESARKIILLPSEIDLEQIRDFIIYLDQAAKRSDRNLGDDRVTSYFKRNRTGTPFSITRLTAFLLNSWVN